MPMLGLLLACSVCALATQAPRRAGITAQTVAAAQEQEDENFLDLTKYKPVERQTEAGTAFTGKQVAAN